MAIPANVRELWSAYAQAAGDVDEARFHEPFHFGDNESLANDLAALVLSGVKRATATSLWSLQTQSKRLPATGDLSVVTSWGGTPLCIIETRAVAIAPFRHVSGEFAAAEGEGDRSLSYWRAAHQAFFSRECARMGLQFTEDMPVVCEHFVVVHRTLQP